MNGEANAGKSKVKLTITTLSPLHVGSGDRLREGFDFLARDGSLWFADQRRLLNAILDEAAQMGQDDADVIQAITGMTLYDLLDAGWLEQSHFDLERRLFRYRLSGQTSTAHKEGELHDQIKDAYGRPYLPGSTLKGALRTMLAWDDLTTRNRTLRAQELDRRAKFAAQPVEQGIFGRNPNQDLLRALIVPRQQIHGDRRSGIGPGLADAGQERPGQTDHRYGSHPSQCDHRLRPAAG